MRLSRAALAAVMIAGSTAVATGPASPASADDGVSLGVATVSDLVVDGPRRRILVSDAESSEIVVFDYDGNRIDRVPDLPGVGALSLSADAKTLYAALTGTNTILALSTATLTETKRYPLGDHVEVTDIAPAGDRIWFGYDDTADYGRGKFGSVDDSGTVREQAAGLPYAYDAPQVFTSPLAPGVLVVTETGTSNGDAWVYDVSTGTPALTSQGDGGWYSSDIAFVSGTEFIRISDRFSRVRISDFAQTELPTFRGGSVEVAEDGRIATAGEELFVYDSAQQVDWTVTLPGYAEKLAWEPGGDRLFAVTQKYPGTFRLSTVSEPEPPAPPKDTPEVTLSGPQYAQTYQKLTLTGKITLVPAGTTLTVTRTDPATPAGKVIGTVTTAASGTFTVTDTPVADGTTTYTVAYSGEAFEAASASVSVTTYRPTPNLIVTAPKSGTVYAYGSTVTITAKLGATYDSRVVEIWADPMGSQPNRLLKRGTVDSKGQLSTTFKLTRNTSFMARFNGDSRYQARVNYSEVKTKVKISTKVLQPYVKVKKVGSVKYYVFKKSTKRKPRFTVTMTSHPDRLFRVTLQRYSGGKWKTIQSERIPADDDGVTLLQLSGTWAAGTKLRMRPAYENTTYGDNTNYPTVGAWSYLTFVK